MSAMPPRQTRIVATLGPATDTEAGIRRLLELGVDVFRINFSHGTAVRHRATIRRVRALARETGVEAAILQDLCGPKIRVGEFADGSIVLETGQACRIATAPCTGTGTCFSTSYERLAEDVAPGARILLDDGALELDVTATEGGAVHCRVLRGGVLRSHKGMNLPGVHLTAPSVTEKDVSDLRVGIAEGVDFVALSFVRHPDDVRGVRRLLDEVGCAAQVIAKIEKPEAVDRIDGIVDAAHGILVARGDLGVEMDLARVSTLQKKLVRRANELDKYVIVATQMLESMLAHPAPTRAEVSDVTNAIVDGADAVMLSGETAVGAYPFEAVAVMDRVARAAETYIGRGAPNWDWHRLNAVNPVQDAIGRAVHDLCDDLGAKAVVAFSATGGTALFLSKNRPGVPIVTFTRDAAAARRMRLFWGVLPVLEDGIFSRDDLLAAARRRLPEAGIGGTGDTFVAVVGTRFGQVGGTNAIEVGML